jgi:mono/diheme cytochrome c family protein
MRSPATLAFAALALVIAGVACTPTKEPPAQESEAVREGRRIFRADGCPTCHGQDRMGTINGPSLEGLRARWTEDALERFLRDPSTARRADPRLRQLSQRYKTSMPSPARIDEARMKVLVAYMFQD